MIEAFAIAFALACYIAHNFIGIDQHWLVLPLVVMICLVGLRAPVKILLLNGQIQSTLKLIIGTPRLIFNAAVSLLYGYSFIGMAYLPSSSFELGMVRPALFTELQQVVLDAACLTLIALSLISVTSRPWKDHWTLSRYVEPNHNKMYINYSTVIICFLLLNVISISIRIYAYTHGWTNLISEGGYGDIFGPFAAFASIIAAVGRFLPAAWMTIFFLSNKKLAYTFAIASWIFEAAYGVVYGTKANILIPTVALLFSVVFYSNKIPLKRMLIFSFLIVPLVAIAMGARTAAFNGLVAGDTGITSFVLTSAKFGLSGGDSYGTAGDLSAGSYLLSRFNVAIPFLAAIARVKQHGPTLDIGPYLNIVFALVPSFIFSFKPMPFNPNQFGRDVGLINANDTLTSVRPSYFGDLYYNFGVLGIIVGSIAIGLFLKFIGQSKSHGYRGLFILFCAITLIDVENSLSNAFGGVIKGFIIFYMIEKVSLVSRHHHTIHRHKFITE